MSTRRPRFKRIPDPPLIVLTDRDREVIRLLARHRFLASPEILALSSGSPQQLLRRLQALFHHGYLDRPRAQLRYFESGGNRHMVYGLGKRAREVLGDDSPATSVSSSDATSLFLDHTLFVARVLVAIELACRKSGEVEFLDDNKLGPSPDPPSFRWQVDFPGGASLGVIPDGTFALEHSRQDGNREKAYFFLEADRGTMPVVRRNLTQTSFFRKLLAYEATWKTNRVRDRFGFHRFRVVTVTQSSERVESLVRAVQELQSGQGLFLFADTSILDAPLDLHSHKWRNGRGFPTALLP